MPEFLEPFKKNILAKMRERPLRQWPAWSGELFDIHVPQGIPIKVEANEECGTHIGLLLELLDSTLDIPGLVAECGVFRGNSLVPMGLFLKEKQPDKKLLGFDSFEGFDGDVLVDRERFGASEWNRPGYFSDTSKARVQDQLTFFGLPEVELIQGFFRDSLPQFTDESFCFVHLDCDIYQSYRECLQFFYPRMPKGGVILLDEYRNRNWKGCEKAVDEFLATRPEKPAQIQRDRYIKYFIRKQ